MMRLYKLKATATVLLSYSAIICMAEESAEQPDSTIINVDIPQKYIEADILKNQYAELLDIEKQIRLTHNMLVDLNYMSPGVERKVTQQLDGLNSRLDSVYDQLESITDKGVKAESKPYRVTVKDCRQKIKKCFSLLKKKSKK